MAATDVERLEAELRLESQDFAIVLSARSALRAVPALSYLLNRQRNFKSRNTADAVVLPIFRALHCSWLVAASPGSLPLAWVHNAAEEAENIAKSVGSDVRTALFVPAYAAYAAAENNTPYTAAVAMLDAPRANSAAALLTAFPAGRRQMAGRIEERTREALLSDRAALRVGLDPTLLARQPLWSARKELAWMRNAWGWVEDALHASGDDWQVWIDWYNGRIQGRSFNEKNETAVAELVNDLWSEGPKFINAQLRQLFDEHGFQRGQSRDRVEPLRDADELEKALREFQTAIELSPYDLAAWFGRVEVLRELGRLDEALIAYDGALARFPDHESLWIGRAQVLREMGRFDEALRMYERVAEQFPNELALTGRAEIFRKIGQYEDAMQAYDRAIEQFPQSAISFNGRAAILHDLGRLVEALNAYEDTIARFPNDVVASNGRAEVLAAIDRLRELPSPAENAVPPSLDAIPNQERRAFQFAATVEGPIDLASASPAGEHLGGGPNQQEDYKELRTKALDLNVLGSNRLGRLYSPIIRFLELGESVDRIRTKMFWSRINTFRIILQSHENAMASKVGNSEPDERQLELSVAPLLQDLVETINVFVVGDTGLMELDAVRPGPQETEIAKEEVGVLAPVLDDLGTNSNVATGSARGVLSEQVDNLKIEDASLSGRQAVEFSRRTIQNFIGELLRRAYAPVRAVLLVAKTEIGAAWKGVREGAYRAVGTGSVTGVVTDLAGVTDFSGAIVRFVVRHADALVAYVAKAFQNPMLVEIIKWISRFGS